MARVSWTKVAAALRALHTYARDGKVYCKLCGEPICRVGERGLSVLAAIRRHFKEKHDTVYRHVQEEIAKSGSPPVVAEKMLLTTVISEIVKTICTSHSCTPGLIRDVVAAYIIAAQRELGIYSGVTLEDAVKLAESVYENLRRKTLEISTTGHIT